VEHSHAGINGRIQSPRSDQSRKTAVKGAKAHQHFSKMVPNRKCFTASRPKYLETFFGGIDLEELLGIIASSKDYNLSVDEYGVRRIDQEPPHAS
jgi:hypothetical protein